MEIQASPSVGTLLFPLGLYADVSCVYAVWEVGTPVQGLEVLSPQIPLSAQEQVLSPLTFSFSEITKGIFKATKTYCAFATNHLKIYCLVMSHLAK